MLYIKYRTIVWGGKLYSNSEGHHLLNSRQLVQMSHIDEEKVQYNTHSRPNFRELRRKMKPE